MIKFEFFITFNILYLWNSVIFVLKVQCEKVIVNVYHTKRSVPEKIGCIL